MDTSSPLNGDKMMVLRVDKLPVSSECDMQVDLSVLPLFISVNFDLLSLLLDWTADLQVDMIMIAVIVAMMRP